MNKNHKHIIIIIVSVFGLLLFCCRTPETDISEEWVYIGLDNKQVTDWAVSEDHLYVSTGDSGLWRYNLDNSGLAWEYLGFSKDDSTALNKGGVTDILVFDNHPDQLLITTGFDDADTSRHFIFKSIDDGITWEAADGGLIVESNGYVHKKRVYILEQLSDRIIGAGGISGIYETSDFGETWMALDTTIEMNGSVLRKNPYNENIIWYGGRSFHFTPKLLFSSNRGYTWNAITNYPSFSTDNNIDFIGFISDENSVVIYLYGELLNSTDLGATWDTLSVHYFDNVVYDKLNNSNYFASKSDTLFSSWDGGVNWIGMETPTINEIHSLYFDFVAQKLYISTNNGIYVKIIDD